MIPRLIGFSACILFVLAVACTRQPGDSRVIVEIPPGFTGNFVLEMGARDAPPLPRHDDAYVVSVPREGRLSTSTLIQRPKLTFKNAASGSIWGYSQSMFTTGDGISVGGKIEFFVGSQKDYEAEQSRKNHSGRDPATVEIYMSGV